jgi:dienelactone hydrolase
MFTMLSHKKRENLVIIVHEIYGVNPHMRYFSKLIENLGMDVLCPNLYPIGISLGEREEDVYKNFFQHVGFQKAASTIKGLIEENRTKYKNIYVVGFSVGATVAWLCSDHEYVSGIICFYGSRIRNYIQMKPTTLTLLLFSNKEKSFNVDSLIKELEKQENKHIHIHLFDAKHGFANPYSKEFCPKAFDASFAILESAFHHTMEIKKG